MVSHVTHYTKDACNRLPMILRFREPPKVVGGTNDPIRCFYAARQFFIAAKTLVLLQILSSAGFAG